MTADSRRRPTRVVARAYHCGTGGLVHHPVSADGMLPRALCRILARPTGRARLAQAEETTAIPAASSPSVVPHHSVPSTDPSTP